MQERSMEPAAAERDVHGLVDHLFRHQAARLVSILVRHLGGKHLDLAEEVVQDVLMTALQHWPFHGVPSNPEGWIMRAARNRAIDRLRRDRAFADRMPALTKALYDEEARYNADADERVDRLSRKVVPLDEEMCMLFMACHPELPRDARVALTLRTVGGFSIAEIARAFLAQEPTIAQRLVRAKQRLRDRAIAFELPGPEDLSERLDSVLDVLYLMFNEGHTAHAGEALVRRDLCETAIHLCEQLAAYPVTDRPKTHALLALMLLQAARLPARTGDAGELSLLDEQDRALWDRELIARGFAHLELAAQGEELTTYHLQAGIASCHAQASSAGETNWARMLDFYDQLMVVQPSPVAWLNRAVALARVEGPRAALDSLETVAADPALRRYHLWHAVRGALAAEIGDVREAAEQYRAALKCQCTDPERRFLEMKLAEMERRSTSQ
jgi:RNA polymerase sigma-70 factor (ECF subfamily)